MRLLASRSYSTDPRDEARRLIDENIRYRLADKVNNALKRTGLQKALKTAVTKLPRP
jgi:hypothetical protein